MEEKGVCRHKGASLMGRHRQTEGRAIHVGLRDMEWVEEVCDRLRKGAVLGCKGEGRWPTKGQNTQSTYEEGARMADSLQTYINDGFVCGLFKEEEMPWPV